MSNSHLTLARVRELLKYDPETGVFTWRVRVSNRRAGSAAGTLRPDGYLNISIDGQTSLAHRLAWFYMTGKWPQEIVDHRDRNKANNAFENLRDTSYQFNNQNSTTSRAHSKSGLMGVSEKENGKFFARIKLANRKVFYIGTFDTADEAAKAYMAEKMKAHEGFAS
jgi:hypothetical protein